jgi:hypothetical protein
MYPNRASTSKKNNNNIPKNKTKSSYNEYQKQLSFVGVEVRRSGTVERMAHGYRYVYGYYDDENDVYPSHMHICK